MTEQRSENLPHFEYFDIDINRARKGAAEIDLVLGKLQSADRAEIFSSRLEPRLDQVAAVLLGIKPCADVDDTSSVFDAISKLQASGELSQDYAVRDGMFYSKNKVVQTVEKYPEVFDLTARDKFEVEDILTGFLNPRIGIDPKLTTATGVLFGYPLDAAQSFIKYHKYYMHFIVYARNHREDNEVFEHFGENRIGEKGETNQWRDNNKNRIREVIEQNEEFRDFPEDAKEYISSARVIDSRGFGFRIESSSPSYNNFENLVSDVFDDSGASEIYKKYKNRS